MHALNKVAAESRLRRIGLRRSGAWGEGHDIRPRMRRIESGWTAKDRHITVRRARGLTKWRTLMEGHDFDADLILTELRAGRISRRQALKALGAAGIGASMISLIADGALADSAQPMGPGGIPLAPQDHPVTLPLPEEPIKTGLQPETGGTFRLFNYQDYFDKKLIDEFGKKYNVKMELTTFASMGQAITPLA